MHRISSSGGRDLAVYWLPAVALLLCLIGRARALLLLLPAMLGCLGLETVFKTLSDRARPSQTQGLHFDSFPSGHALAEPRSSPARSWWSCFPPAAIAGSARFSGPRQARGRC